MKFTLGPTTERTSPASSRRRPRLILALWVAIVAVALPFTARQSDHLTSGGYSVPGSGSSAVNDILAREYPRMSRATIAVLLWPHKGATTDDLRLAIGHVAGAVRGISGVELPSRISSSATGAARKVTPIVLPLHVSASEERAEDIARILRERLRPGAGVRGGVDVHLLGESALWAGLNETSKQQLIRAEVIGFPILLLVLLLIFGSLSAALLPIVLGAVAVTVAGAFIYLLSLTMQLSVFVTDTASMLGIGLAVDYSLIILARVRQELAAGHELPQALATANATSGRAVRFSGLTVIASLVGVWVIPNGTLRSMALGAMLVVAVAMLASLTLLPALIEILGARRVSANLFAARLAGHNRQRDRRGAGLSWERWTAVVTGHPLLSIAVSGSVLLLLCIPALSIHTSTGALQQLSPNNETHVGFAEAAALQGPGLLGPVNVTVHSSARASEIVLDHEVRRLVHTAAGLPHVHEIGPPEISRDRSYALLTIVPSVDPESPDAAQLVRQLRRSPAAALPGHELTVAVGGTSASLLDEEQEIAHSLWKLIFAVLGLAFIVLTVLLRSLLLPLKAIVMNLLSVGAAYGVLVMTFQWGWFDAIFGYHSPGHVDTLIPPLILAIVFGLSMDYEVFLLTRIKERWLASGDSKKAVAEGLATSASTISSAALVLVCVFAVFVGTGLPSIKEIGVGAAVAIALDVTLIRLVLVPATMELLGEWNWWLPKRIDRLLPATPGITGAQTSPT